MRRLCCAFAAVLFWAFAAVAGAYGLTPEDVYPQEISPEDIQREAIAYIDETMAALGDTRRYTIETVHIPRALRAPEGEISFKAKTPNGLRFWGNTAVYMDVLVDGAPFRQVKCQFKMHVFDRVAVAARPLTPGQPLTAADYRFEEQEVGTKGAKFMGENDVLVGKVLSRSLSIGMPILRAMLKLPDIVQPGSPVTLISKQNGVAVKMEGVALEAGHEGEVIRVRNTASRKILRGRILDEFTVEIVRK